MIKYILLLCNIFGIYTIAFCQYTDPAVSVTGIRFKSRLPMGWNDTDMVSLNSYDVYHCGHLIQYRLTVHFDSSVNDELMLAEERYQYFVYDRDSAYGILYGDFANRITGTSTGRFPVDSVIADYNYASNLYAGEKDRKPDSLYVNADHELVNVFEFKKTGRYTEDASFFYYYSAAFKDIPETLNRTFDTTNGLKLYKIVARAHGAYYPQSKASTKERNLIYEMQRPSPGELLTAQDYFKKYQHSVRH